MKNRNLILNSILVLSFTLLAGPNAALAQNKKVDCSVRVDLGKVVEAGDGNQKRTGSLRLQVEGATFLKEGGERESLGYAENSVKAQEIWKQYCKNEWVVPVEWTVAQENLKKYNAVEMPNCVGKAIDFKNPAKSGVYSYEQILLSNDAYRVAKIKFEINQCLKFEALKKQLADTQAKLDQCHANQTGGPNYVNKDQSKPGVLNPPANNPPIDPPAKKATH